jgi:Fur family ferric uptake transcriptional regulator
VISTQTLPCGRPRPKVHQPRRDSGALHREMELKLNAYVTEKGLNHSEARTKILEVIALEGFHFRAQDLVEKLQKRYPEVGRSTVYRNLPILVECGLIQEGPADPDGQALYELANEDHHDHIVCTDCGGIFEFHDDAIEKRQEEISKQLGFLAKSHRHVVYGACQYLQKKP